MHTIQNAIDGSKFTSASRRMAPVYNPATGEQTADLPLSTVDEVNEAVAAAKKAAAGWGAMPPLIIEKREIDQLVEIFGSVLKTAN